MAENIKLYETVADYQAQEGGSEEYGYVLYGGSRLELLPNNNLPTYVNNVTGTTPFDGNARYCLDVYEQDEAELIGKYVDYPEGNIPSGTTVVGYGRYVKNGNTWVWDSTAQTTQTADHEVYCAVHNNKRYYSWNDPFGRYGTFTIQLVEKTDEPGTYINLPGGRPAVLTIVPKSNMGGIVSVVPGVGYIVESDKVEYNAPVLPELSFLLSQGTGTGTTLQWSDCGVTDSIFNKYDELASYGDTAFESYNVKFNNEYPGYVGWDDGILAFSFSDDYHVDFNPVTKTIFVYQVQYH